MIRAVSWLAFPHSNVTVYNKPRYNTDQLSEPCGEGDEADERPFSLFFRNFSWEPYKNVPYMDSLSREIAMDSNNNILNKQWGDLI